MNIYIFIALGEIKTNNHKSLTSEWTVSTDDTVK